MKQIWLIVMLLALMILLVACNAEQTADLATNPAAPYSAVESNPNATIDNNTIDTEYSDDVNRYIKQKEYGYILEGDIYLKSLDKSLLNIVGEHKTGGDLNYPIYEYKGR